MGCSLDEYNPEIMEIFLALQKTINVNQLHDMVYEIFVGMFDEDIAGPKEKYRKLCEELHSLRTFLLG